MYTTLHKVTLEGQDLKTFLQRIITQDTSTCHQPKLSAICNPYGKVVITFWIQVDDTATLYVDQTLSESLIKVLQFYDPFSDLTISLDTNNPKTTDIYPQAKDPWALHLIKNNIITLTPDTQKKYTAHILCLDQHNAVSFTKGCFIGHEPISRTQFKGSVKRRLRYQSQVTKPDDAINLYFEDPIYHYLSVQPI